MDKETYKFTYAIGNIEQVCRGDVERVDSINELEEVASEIIIIPKLIGVYQNYSNERFRNDYELLEKSNQTVALIQRGKIDGLCPDLICVAYDPAITPLDILGQPRELDAFERLKFVEYYELDDLDFYNKPRLSDISKRVSNAIENPSGENLSLVTCAKESLMFSRTDYGLTRTEAITLLAAKKLLSQNGLEVELITDKSSLDFGEIMLELFKD